MATQPPLPSAEYHLTTYKVMDNNDIAGFTQNSKETTLEAVGQFKYLGVIITDEGWNTFLS